MIKLKNLLREDRDTTAKYYWMDPRGKLSRVPLQGHESFATTYLKSIGKLNHNESVYPQMAKLGWIRVTVFGHEGQYHVSFNKGVGLYPNSEQMEVLMDMAKAVYATDVRDDSNGKRYNVI